MELSERQTAIATVASNLFLGAAVVVMFMYPTSADHGYEDLGALIEAKAPPEEISIAWSNAFAQWERALSRHMMLIASLLLGHVWLELALHATLVSLVGQLYWSGMALFYMQLSRWHPGLPPYALLLDCLIVATIYLILHRLVLLYRNRKLGSPKIESSAL